MNPNMFVFFAALISLTPPGYGAPLTSIEKTKLQIQTAVSPHKFIEDQKIRFKCSTSDSSLKVKWLLRDSDSGMKTFYEDTISLETWKKVDEKGNSRFDLIMRRDFEGMELVCKTESDEATYLITKIEVKLPIEEVRFVTTDLVRDENFHLWCDVKSKTKAVKAVEFRNPYSFYAASRNWSQDRGLSRYEYARNFKVRVEDFDQLLHQCIASVKPEIEKTGNVMSKMVRIRVHHFAFLSFLSNQSTTTVKRGQSLRISFVVDANPKPKKTKLCVKSEFANVTHQVNSIDFKSKGGPLYLLHMNLTPYHSGQYSIHYITDLFSNKSKPFFVNVTYFELREVNEWKPKTVHRGEFLRLHLLLSARPLPSENEIVFSFLQETQKPFHPDSIIKAELTRKISKDVLHFALDVLPSSSGMYRLAVKAASSTAEGPSFQMTVKELEPISNKSHKVLIITVIVIIIVAVFIFGILFYKRCLRCPMPPYQIQITGCLDLTLSVTSDYQLQKILDKVKQPEVSFLQMFVLKGNKLINNENLDIKVDGNRCLESYRVSKGCRIVLKAVHSLDITFITAGFQTISKHKVEIEKGHRNWGAICEKCMKENSDCPSLKNTIAFQFGYLNKRGLGIDTPNGCVIEDSGKFIDWDENEMFFEKNLRGDSAIRFPPKSSASVFIRTNCDLLEYGENGNLEMIGEGIDPFFDESFKAYAFGLRFRDENENDGWRYFFALTEGPFLSKSDGTMFSEEKDVVKKYPTSNWRSFCLFFKSEIFENDDKSDDTRKMGPYRSRLTILLYRRLHYRLEKENGKISLEGPEEMMQKLLLTGEEHVSEWYRPKASEEADRFFTHRFRKALEIDD